MRACEDEGIVLVSALRVWDGAPQRGGTQEEGEGFSCGQAGTRVFEVQPEASFVCCVQVWSSEIWE